MKKGIFLLIQVGYKNLYNNSKIYSVVNANCHPRLTYAVLSGAIKSVGYNTVGNFILDQRLFWKCL